MLVVGDCFAAKPSAQHATTATCDSDLMETLEHKQRHKIYHSERNKIQFIIIMELIFSTHQLIYKLFLIRAQADANSGTNSGHKSYFQFLKILFSFKNEINSSSQISNRTILPDLSIKKFAGM